jgi:hypothetical protein
MEGRPSVPRQAILILALLLSFATSGCGGEASKHRRETSQHASSAKTANDPASGTSTASSAWYLNDGDRERVGDPDSDNNADNDHDASRDYLPSDYKPGENGHYHDTDDRSFLHEGHAADASDAQTISAAVTRYYAMVAAGNGVAACAQVTQRLAQAAPVDYGQLGPAYLRGSKTCAAVIARLSKHFRGELSTPVAVTSVRISNGQTFALIGSRTMPAGYTTVEREKNTWKVAQLLPTKLL